MCLEVVGVLSKEHRARSLTKKEGGLMSSKNQRVKTEISRNVELVRELAEAPKPKPVVQPTIRKPLQRLSNTIGEAYLEALANKSQ
jgi:hypothetical protein